MKRGLIAREIPLEVFEQRLGRVRAALTERDLPALLVYTDVWRSNQGRFLTNFMPYWNRSLIVIPREGAPVLHCGLSPRVYPWIKSVTIFEEIRSGIKLAPSWTRIGVLDLPKLPVEIRAGLGGIEVVDVPSTGLTDPDDAEFAMRRKAVKLAREVDLTNAAGEIERQLRRAGAEDLVIRVRPRGDDYSISLALEYCGHWVKVVRAHAPAGELIELEQRFHAALINGSKGGGYRENLDGPQPFESPAFFKERAGVIFALQVEHQGLWFGDTCTGTETL